MLKKVILCAMIFIGISSMSAFAVDRNVHFGVRDGVMIGLGVEDELVEYFDYRLLAGVKTGENPLIVSLSGKFYAFDLFRRKINMGLGVVFDFGQKSKAGGTISLIADKVFGPKNLFNLEFGFDVKDSSSLFISLSHPIK